MLRIHTSNHRSDTHVPFVGARAARIAHVHIGLRCPSLWTFTFSERLVMNMAESPHGLQVFQSVLDGHVPSRSLRSCTIRLLLACARALARRPQSPPPADHASRRLGYRTHDSKPILVPKRHAQPD